ncbi:MAG: transcriptional regulator [Firmicutes bacterium HGW-Firmicutes-12]|nr:MAG: transcriptional regulator [Firmicutes bacterium HGW-Firmicutes-12]
MVDGICEIKSVDRQKVIRVKEEMLSYTDVQELANIYKAMGDETRITILYALSCAELCVCELTQLLDISQSAISHQLRLLRNLRLVKYRKEGKQVFYSLDDEHILNLFSQGIAHIQHR